MSAALARPQELGQAAEDYLKAAIATATSHVYVAPTVVAGLTIAGVLLLMPRRFDTTPGFAPAPRTDRKMPGFHAPRPPLACVTYHPSRVGQTSRTGQTPHVWGETPHVWGDM